MHRHTVLVSVLCLAAALPGPASAFPYHAPIFLNGDADLCTPGSGVTNCATADGSATRPYRIEAWYVSAAAGATAVRIQFVTKYVQVLNNDVRGTPTSSGTPTIGVMVWASDHIVVQGNTFTGVDWGVLGADGAGLQVVRNTFNVGGVGVLVDATRNAVIDHNLFRNGFEGVSIRGMNARVTLNQFQDLAYAIDVQAEGGGLVAARNNMVRTAQFALETFTESFVDARCNWWDATTGPSLGPDYHPPGGRVYGHATVSPYLTKADRYTGPGGNDPLVAPIDLSQGWQHAGDETLYWLLSPCYDEIPGGPY